MKSLLNYKTLVCFPWAFLEINEPKLYEPPFKNTRDIYFFINLVNSTPINASDEDVEKVGFLQHIYITVGMSISGQTKRKSFEINQKFTKTLQANLMKTIENEKFILEIKSNKLMERTKEVATNIFS